MAKKFTKLVLEGQGGGIKLQEKTIDITSNSKVIVEPDEGYTLSKVTANVDVQGEAFALPQVRPRITFPTNVPVMMATATFAIAIQDITNISVTKGA